MAVIEAFMLSLIIYTGIISSYGDIKYGIVKNRLIAVISALGIVINIVYYITVKKYIVYYITNTVIISAISIFFYFFDIWSAGDSKLLIAEALLIPGRLYYSESISLSAGIIVIIFVLAYTYIIAETLFLGIKNKNLFSDIKLAKINKKAIFSALRRYIVCGMYLSILNIIFARFMPYILYENKPLFMLSDMLLILLVYRIPVLTGSIMTVAALIFSAAVWIMGGLKPNIRINAAPFILLAFTLIFRAFSYKYNYKEIKVSEIKAGMVLSLSAIIQFGKSRVSGLPKSTTEDMRSKITESEAESIRRWQNSKYGSDTLIIVRKLPFAAFIALGVVLFILIRMISL